LTKLAPIIFFTYNRPSHCLSTLNSLKRTEFAEDSDLIIFSDGPKCVEDIDNIQEIRRILKTLDGFASIKVIERETNFGLKRSIIEGVSQVLEERGRAIIVEDDLEFSRGFLGFMNRSLEFYERYKEVGSISGYSFPVKVPEGYEFDTYFFFRSSSWGWGTWKDRWERADWEVSEFNVFSRDIHRIRAFNRGGDDLFEMLKQQVEGNIDTWDIQWCYEHYKHSAYCVYPVTSFVNNTGCDGSGVHKVETSFYDVNLEEMDLDRIRLCKPEVADENIIRLVQGMFSYPVGKRIRKYFKLYLPGKFSGS